MGVYFSESGVTIQDIVDCLSEVSGGHAECDSSVPHGKEIVIDFEGTKKKERFHCLTGNNVSEFDCPSGCAIGKDSIRVCSISEEDKLLRKVAKRLGGFFLLTSFVNETEDCWFWVKYKKNMNTVGRTKRRRRLFGFLKN